MILHNLKKFIWKSCNVLLKIKNQKIKIKIVVRLRGTIKIVVRLRGTIKIVVRLRGTIDQTLND